MLIAGRYITLPSRRVIWGIVVSVVLLVGAAIPLTLINQQTDTRTRAEVNAAFTSTIDGVAVNGPSLTLPSTTKILIDPNEPAPIQKAALDLQRDIQKVLGQQPSIVGSVAELGGASGIIISYQGTTTSTYRDTSLTGEEAHQFAVRTVSGVNHVVLQGADLRGTLYAIYMFSDKVVGIPPLWYWAEWQPETKSSLQIATNGGLRVTTPQVRYRTWFLNNQDLFGGWTPSSDKYDIVFETMLRLKLNTWYIGEQVGEYGGGWLPKAQAAQNRGLQLAANNLAQFRRWDDYWTDIRQTSVPSLKLSNKAKFDEFWRYSLQYAKDNNLDVLWILGFRGRGDDAFWNAMSDAPTTETARGDVEEQMLVRQMQLVREVTGQAHPKMAFILWNELTTLAENGRLQIPKDVDLIWTFGNDIRDHFPRKDARTYKILTNQPYGFYMNLQFYSTGAHLADIEGPWKVWKNFSILAARKPGGRVDMAILNVGNVREFLITAASTSEMMWNIGAYNPDTSLQKIFARYFSSTLASSLTTTYKSLMNAYWQQKRSDISGFDKQYIFQDLRIKEATKVQLSKIRAKSRNLNPFNNDRLRIDNTYNKANSQVGSVMLGSQKAYQSLENVAGTIDGFTAQIPASKQAFYKDVFRVPARFMAIAYKTLYLVTRSHFKVSANLTETSCYLQDAQIEVAKLQPALNEAKHGQFSTWYNGEALFGVQALQNDINTTMNTLPQTSCFVSASNLTPTPTLTSGGDLTITSFVLTDKNGVTRSSFQPGEAIYAKVTLKNQGTQKVDTSTGRTYTQIYSNAPSQVAQGQASDVNVYVRNGEFTANLEKTYGSSNVGPNSGFYAEAKYWSKSSPGTYTARAYINYDQAGAESSYTNNQLTVTYTVSGTAPTPTLAQGAATPTPTSTPTPIPSELTLSSHPSTSGLKASNVKDGKRTVFRAMRSMTLKQIACYGCGSGAKFILRHSSSSYALGSQLVSVSAQGVSSSWGYANVNVPLIGGHYYILEFTPSVTPVYYGSVAKLYTDFQFVKYATVGAPSWKTGAWQIRLMYQK